MRFRDVLWGWLWYFMKRVFFDIRRLPQLVWGSRNSESIVEIGREKPPLLFIFVGECGSGKSTAIASIFLAKSSHPSAVVIDIPSTIEHNEINADDSCNNFSLWTLRPSKNTEHPIKIVEVPGFLQNHFLEQDATILTALVSFLKKESLDRLPTALIVTARLTDNRFEGSLSLFSQTLKCLIPARHLFTDSACSNVILLLTHADMAEVSPIEPRMDGYKRAFLAIFNENQTHFVDSNKLVTISIGKGGIGSVYVFCEQVSKAISHSSNFNLLHKFLKSPPLKNSVSTEEYDFSWEHMNTFIPSGSLGRIRNIAGFMMGDNVDLARRLLEDSDIEEGDFMSDSGFPNDKIFQVPIDSFEFATGSLQPATVHNCVYPKSKIILASGNSISAEECLVGDRVLGYNSVVGVITKICALNKSHLPAGANHLRMYTCSDCNNGQFSHLSMLFRRSVPRENSEDTTSRLFFYREESKSFINKKFDNDMKKKFSDPFRSPQEVIIVEVDNGLGTFIVDNYVRACQMDKNG